jgi:PAS domain S-box-containing protein
LVLDGTTHEILEANPCTLELLGHSKADLLGNRLSDIGILSSESDYQKLFGRLTAEASVRFEHSRRNPETGQATELEFVCNCYDEDGRPIIQCNIRDIAERREAERKLRDALGQLRTAKHALETRVLERTADLQERNAELEAFSYSLSHDLRAPIRAIVSFTQLALEECGARVGPSSTEYLQKAITAAQRLDLLILDVLEFSKTTRQKLRTETVNLERLLQDIFEERPEWVARKAEITIVRPLLPVRGDRASLTQCLTNLLDNAVKFIPAGKVARVRIFTEPVGKRVRLNIVDNGIGIPLSAQPKVFELFQRAHNGYEGHGIGLAIVKRAAERMGGSVGVDSRPDEGSTFWLELPAPNQAPSS